MPAAYARGHYVNGKGRSLMSYADNCSNGCDRKSNISNPDVDFGFGQCQRHQQLKGQRPLRRPDGGQRRRLQLR